jgi:hypothetical protein
MVGVRVSRYDIIESFNALSVEIADNLISLRMFTAVYEHIFAAAADVNAVPLPYIDEMNSEIVVSRLVNTASYAVPYNYRYQQENTEYYCADSA